MYRCEASSVAGFIQQLAVAYVAHGYWFYVTSQIPPHKDPRRTDEKIIRQYGLDISKWTRCRRRKEGVASVQYLRYERFSVILATHGSHEFFHMESKVLRDIRRVPLKLAGYSVGCKQATAKWHPSVRIEERVYRRLKERFSLMALDADEVIYAQLQALPFEPFAPIRRQLLSILRAINRRRRVARLEPVPVRALRLARQPVVALKSSVDVKGPFCGQYPTRVASPRGPRDSSCRKAP